MTISRATLLASIVIAASCVKKTDVTKVDPSMFFGSWASACKQEASNLSTTYVNTISEQTWSFVRDQFNSPDCSGPSTLKMRVESTITFESEGVSSRSKNYKQVMGKTYVTPLSQGALASLQQSTQANTWTLGSEAEYNIGFAEENAVVYNVMKIVDGKLCLGKEDDSRDKTTPEKRPVEIDIKDCLQKK